MRFKTTFIALILALLVFPALAVPVVNIQQPTSTKLTEEAEQICSQAVFDGFLRPVIDEIIAGVSVEAMAEIQTANDKRKGVDPTFTPVKIKAIKALHEFYVTRTPEKEAAVDAVLAELVNMCVTKSVKRYKEKNPTSPAKLSI